MVEMVNCRDHLDNPAERYCSMNYISYTATPYANFLSDSTEEGLYPSNFVALLKPSSTYIGPREIFGSELNPVYGGMDIIRTDGNPEKEILPVHDNPTAPLPDGLKKAISWFICCVASLRYRRKNKPKTMLIHTSNQTGPHENVARAVKHYLNEEKTSIKDLCREVFVEETKYSRDQFLWNLPDYGNKDAIEPYPQFSEISHMIDEILEYGTSQTYQIDDGDIQYSRGINLCIDNSKDTVIEDDNSDRAYHPRLIYPDPDSKEYDEGLAFIVIGGNTVSRGLTLEGLCSTYFARVAKQGDTLMQMSRWFGYRIGYELYPRIWMSKESYQEFQELAYIDEELRDFINRNYSHFTPEDYPPIIKKFPPSSRIKKITGKDSAAVDADYNFTGTLNEVSVFDRSDDIISENQDTTLAFLEGLGQSEKGFKRNARVWRNVSESDVDDYLHKMKICHRARNYDTLDQLIKWSDRTISNDWNVMLAGIDSDFDNGEWGPHGSRVTRVSRSAKKLKTEDNSIHIGSLSEPKDRYADIIFNESAEEKTFLAEHEDNPSENWGDIRNFEDFGVSDTPLLIIYPIRGDSMPSRKETLRAPIDCRFDQTIIGLAIIIPGSFNNNNLTNYVTIERGSHHGSRNPEE